MDCDCKEKGLIVWKGFDTRFLDVDWLSISFETRFQTNGFRAKFTICDYSFEWNDLTQPKIINLTDDQTATIPIGLNYGELVVWDDDGNSKPFSTSIPVFCKNWVESENELDTYNMTVNALLDNETQMVIKIETAKVSLDWVLEKIAEHNASEEAHQYIQGRIDDEITARENADSALSDRIDEKQDKLTSENAGEGIAIEEVGGKVIISSTHTSAEWGKISGDIQDQLDLQEEFSTKQDTLIAGDNITILDNVISASGGISEIDGGSASSVYLISQEIDGGDSEEP